MLGGCDADLGRRGAASADDCGPVEEFQDASALHRAPVGRPGHRSQVLPGWRELVVTVKAWLARLLRPRTWVAIALLAVIILVIIAADKWLLPFWNWLRLGTNGPAESHGTTLRNISLLVAGVIALGLALWRSWVGERQTRISQQGLLQDRYQRGAEMLWNPLLSARLVGIYTLHQLAQEHSKQYHILVMQQFCAFARNPTKGHTIEPEPTHGNVSSSDSEQQNGQPRRLREDVQAILKVIGYRSKEMRALEMRGGFKIDLCGADLCDTNLDGADFSGATLVEAKLSRARLIRANLSKAEMRFADLSCSSDVETYRTFLVGAKLDDVNLMYANLSGSNFQEARLSRAKLLEADMSNTFLYRARLIDADLSLTDFSGAVLYEANISGATLGKGHILGSWLTARDEEPTTQITQQQLDQACAAPGNPPQLNGVLDAETGKLLEWNRDGS